MRDKNRVKRVKRIGVQKFVEAFKNQPNAARRNQGCIHLCTKTPSCTSHMFMYFRTRKDAKKAGKLLMQYHQKSGKDTHNLVEFLVDVAMSEITDKTKTPQSVHGHLAELQICERDVPWHKLPIPLWAEVKSDGDMFSGAQHSFFDAPIVAMFYAEQL